MGERIRSRNNFKKLPSSGPKVPSPARSAGQAVGLSRRNGMLPGKLAEKGQNKSKQPDLLPTFRIYYVKYDSSAPTCKVVPFYGDIVTKCDKIDVILDHLHLILVYPIKTYGILSKPVKSASN